MNAMEVELGWGPNDGSTKTKDQPNVIKKEDSEAKSRLHSFEGTTIHDQIRWRGGIHLQLGPSEGSVMKIRPKTAQNPPFPTTVNENHTLGKIQEGPRRRHSRRV